MADCGIRFFLCNIFICIIISVFLLTKRVLQNNFTNRMRFHLWFLLLGFLVMPFIPFRPIGLLQIFSRLGLFHNAASPSLETITGNIVNRNLSNTVTQIDDFALSVSSETSSIMGLIFFWIWIIGMIAMLLFMLQSSIRLHTLKESALPLQSRTVRFLYNDCLSELNIKRKIPVYSTAFLKSPIIVGFFRPCIYLPIHLISDFHVTDMRYILLHELQHYKHKDALASYLMNLIRVLYWCNPLIWYALKEMRCDREIACDTSVLKLLDESDYEDYGNTLINLAEKVSLMPFPFTTGISGNMKQMQRRILNISSYKKRSHFKKRKGLILFMIIGVILFELAPMLSIYAANQNRYQWNIHPDKITTLDLSSYFDGYEGCFVLYDLKRDLWNLYNIEQATLRTAPNSTFKIYDALFGLEEGVITPDHSLMEWDGTEYPFDAWNKNQDLYSAMHVSANWYFEEIDRQIGSSGIQRSIQKIGYGNEKVNSNFPLYSMQSTLKISPIEQVELLIDLYNNNFDFAPEHINAVKDSICFSSTENFSSERKNFYGKTGTGRVDGQDINGWFIGFMEVDDHTYFFATNIQNDSNATGSKAAEITKALLSHLVSPFPF